MRKNLILRVLVILIIISNTSLVLGKKLNKTVGNVKLTIIYDNYDYKDALKSDWGFSCLIERTDKTILFDTGARPSVFKNNFEALNIDAKKIDLVIISHDHYDHTGGLSSFLEYNNDVEIYGIKSFSNKTNKIAEDNGLYFKYEPTIKEICKNVYLSGTLGNKIEEQSLAIHTEKGLVVITGCSHPGINSILEHFKKSLNTNIYMVLGGFHLMRMNKDEMQEIIKEMKDLGIQKCGASHCTGNKQIEMFKKEFGENYVELGVGRVIDLK